MPALTASPIIVFRRRLAILAIAALGLAAALAPSTAARQTLVHAFLAKDGTTVVSGYDGGVPIARPAP